MKCALCGDSQQGSGVFQTGPIVCWQCAKRVCEDAIMVRTAPKKLMDDMDAIYSDAADAAETAELRKLCADGPLVELLGPKHTDMRVSVTGAINNAIDAFQSGKDMTGWRFTFRELSRHLVELGNRFYAGDVKVVDEFLQLYALDANRPK